MKRIARILCIALTVALVLTFTVYAETVTKTAKTLNVPKASGKITIDGKATEAAWKKAAVMPVTTKVPDKCKAANVGKVKVAKIMWDDNYLYCYVEVEDKTPITTLQVYDNLEYHIDAKYCRKGTYNGKCDAQYRLDRAGKVTGWGEYDRKTFKTNAKCIATSTGYVQEVAIKWTSHEITKQKAGAKVGFDIQFSDYVKADATGRNQIVWNSLDEAWTNPSTMGTLILK